MIELYYQEGRTWFRVPLKVGDTLVRPSVLKSQIEGMTMRVVTYSPPADGSYHEYHISGKWYPPSPCKWLQDGGFMDVEPSDIFSVGVAPATLAMEYQKLSGNFERLRTEFLKLEAAYLEVAHSYRALAHN